MFLKTINNLIKNNIFNNKIINNKNIINYKNFNIIINYNSYNFIKFLSSTPNKLFVKSIHKQKNVQDNFMFCFQCEQTKNRKGCETIGVCGKNPKVAGMQNLLCGLTKGLALVSTNLENVGGEVEKEVYDFTFSSLFSTLTNVNFDPERFVFYIRKAYQIREKLYEKYKKKCQEKKIKMNEWKNLIEITWKPLKNGKEEWKEDFLEEEGKKFEVKRDEEIYGKDVNGVREMVVYALKGMSTYARHAHLLGEWEDGLGRGTHEILSFLLDGKEEKRKDLEENLKLALKVGELNLKGLKLLNDGHRVRFGIPQPTQVSTSPVPGKCLLVSGHDMNDLEKILEVADGKGVAVYTHGEMLPAHGYPKLKQHKSLVGHYGGAWQNQKHEFPWFPGPIVMTTNCLIEPLKSYKQRLFTLNETGWPGCTHLSLEKKEDLDLLMQTALKAEGFLKKDVNNKAVPLTTGFGHEAILNQGDEILEAVEKGDLKRIFVVGGCDGSENKRNYFSILADNIPSDSLILTMGCAKFRFNKHHFGNLGNSQIPRLLDLGQCNDSYGAVVVASQLANKLKTDINSLPLSLAISWFEQKALAVLLTLLHLNIQNIRLGPVLPAFLTPRVVSILQERYKLHPVHIKEPLEDLESMKMGK